ncbi:MAG TPA: hypothetical protein VF017_21785 [Thermoanaerobaculia bacterium]|nr:hypothetical protein [Thermoanaerobaculia bacterium]
MSRRPASSRYLGSAVLVFLVASGPPAAADRVELANGQVFEDVVAEEIGHQLRIRLAIGELRIPRSQVVKVTKSETPFQRYEIEKQRLSPYRAGDAAAWLDLARFALDAELVAEGREAALVAARLEPTLPDLAPVLGTLGYVRDPEGGGWIPEADLMARRGLTRYGGRWVPREEVERREHQLALAREQEAAAARERRRELWALDQQRRDRELDLAHREREREREAAPLIQIDNSVLTFIYSFPSPFVIAPVAPGPRPPSTGAERRPSGAPVMDLLERQPGSLIPGELRLGPP